MFLKKTTKSFFVSRSKQLSKIRPYGEQAWAYSVRSYPSTCQSIKGVIHPQKKETSVIISSSVCWTDEEDA